MKIPGEGDHGFTRGMLANDLTEALVKDDEFGELFSHIGDSDVERALPAFLAALPSHEGEPVLPVGAVLRASDPEPPDGTMLLDKGGRVEAYASAEIGHRWRTYAKRMGPFVVAPDYDKLIGD